MAVTGELDAVAETLAQVCEKFPRGLPAAVANVPRGDQLRVRVDRGPCPYVPGLALDLFFNRRIGLLGVNEAPNFIDLNPLTGQVYERPVLIIETGFTGIHDQLGDGVLAGAGQPGHGPDGTTLAKQMEDLGAGPGVELVHSSGQYDPYA